MSQLDLVSSLSNICILKGRIKYTTRSWDETQLSRIFVEC